MCWIYKLSVKIVNSLKIYWKIEKFNDISIPESDIPMRDFSLLDSMSSDIYVPAPSYGSSGGSGCSSCGGGCSSCGGGCSSCGGGGSW